MSHVMIDIETLGKKPGCLVLSVAARKFDPVEQTMEDPFYMRVDLEDAQAHGLVIDADTLNWWMKQEGKVRSSLFDPKIQVNQPKPQPLAMVLHKLSSYVMGVECFWAKSPQFDYVILEHCYSKFEHLECPWNHWQLRDVRTLIAHYSEVTLPQLDKNLAHHALEDVCYQIECVNAITAFRATLEDEAQYAREMLAKQASK